MTKKITFLIAAALMLLTMIVSPGRAVGQTRSTTYEAATSIAVNDVVLLVAESSTYKKELSGFTTSGTIYGTVTDYTSIPNGVYPLTVVAGNSEGSFAFKNSDDQYLSWSSGNSLQLSATLNDNSSWTFNYAYTVTTITNVGTTTRQIKYNSSSPRFACYTSGQQSIKLYKQVSSSLTDSDLALNNAPVALEFDLYNNYDDQTVSYTTSSTGLVAIDDNQYIDTEIDQNNKTITVTPKKVTPSTQTITVNQAADATYAAGSTTFTISIANSAPYTQPTEIEANLNNSLFGTNYSGSASNITDNNPLIGIVDNVTVTYAGSGNHYVNNSQIRFYPNNKLTFEAPSGYEIKQIVFTSAGTWAATISADGGTYNSSTKTWTGSASSVLFTGSGSSRCDMSKADITIGAASSLPTPTITIDATGITNTNVFEGTDAGSLSASVTYNEVAVEGATVTWSGNNDEVATINTTSGAVTLMAAGSVTFTATFAGNENYNSATASYVMTVTNDDPNAPGTENNPYTVADAMAAIDAQGTINEAYVTGIVSQVDSYNSSYHSITYWISDDGETTTQLEVYSGKGLNGANFSSVADVQVGATVVVKGKLKLYNQTYEFDYNNELVSYTAPQVTVEAPTFSPAAGTYDEAQSVTLSCATDGAAIHYTTDGTEPDGNSTQYSEPISVSTTTTFKAKAIKGSNMSSVVTATYHINSASSPYTVAQALAFHEYPTSTIWVHGIVSTAPTQAPTNSGQLTYYISDDGTAGENNQLEVYKGLGLNGAAFTAQDDIQVGDIVTITGIVKIYSSTIEFDTNNQLTYFERPTPTVPTITVDPTSVEVDADEHEGTISVTYTNITDITAEVYFCDVNGDAATYNWILAEINTDNDVYYTIEANNGEARTAYFKVYALDNNAAAVYSDLITINQAAPVTPTPGDEQWVLTPLADLTTSDVFVIVGDNGNTYAMPNNNGASSAPAVVEVIVSSNNTLSGEIANNIKWNISGNATDGYTFYPNGDTESWLYCTNTNNGVRVGTNDNKSFTIDHDYLYNTATGRHVGIYNSQDWRCYTPQSSGEVHTNIAGQTFTFYKKVTGAYVAAPTFDPVGGIYTEAQTVNITCTTEGASLFYKTTENGEWIAYTAALNIAQTTTIWAKAVKEEAESTVATATYTINLPVPSITVAPDVVNVTSEGSNANLTVTCANMGDSPVLNVQFYDNDQTTAVPATTYGWVTAVINEGNLNVTVAANASNARTAYLKVYSNTVYSNLVTITQEAYVAPTYTVTYAANGGTGTMTDPNSPYVAGVEVTLLANTFIAPEGKIWNSWEVKDADNQDVTVNEGKFTMPASNVTVTAQWVDDPYAPTYEWVLTALEDLTSSDVFVIVGTRDNTNYYGMSTDKGTSTQPEAVEVTIANNKLSASPADRIKWNLTGDNSTGYIFYPNGSSTTWLYCNTTATSGSNTNMRVGTGDRKLFVLDNDNYLVTNDENTARYVSLNGSTDWRGYVNTNQATTITFYKRQVASTDPQLSANDVNIASDATAGEIIYNLENEVTGGMLTAEITAGNEGNWLTLGTVSATVPFTCSANNEATERTATVTLTYTYNAKATITATAVVTQAALIVDYATMPFAFDGGRDNIENTNGLTQEGLDTDYNASPKLKFKTQGAYVVLKLNEAPVSLSYDIKGNGSGSDPWAGTFKVQTSADGETYVDLVVYENNLGDKQSVTHIDLASTVRYIKWIYTTKNSGNVALGNIHASTDYDIYGDMTINSDDLAAHPVIVHNGSVVTYEGTNTNAADLIIEDGGQLIHTNNLAATLQKDITAWTTKDVGGWYFIASPVDGAAIDESFDQTAIDLFKYDEQDAYWYSYLDNGHNLHPFSTLTRGVGYLHASESQQTLNFAGMMVGTNEPFSLPLSYACTYDDVKGFNLVGNPYTCNIMSGNMLIGSTPVLPIYVINDEGRTKLTAVTTDTYAIKPGEGFFVQATATNQTLTINPTAKDNFEFRYIKIVAGNENGYDNTFIQLEQGNTLRKMDIAETTSVYVINDGDDYAAARVEELAGTMPVHFKAVEDGEFTITINAKNIEASTMMLFDNQTGELIDLLETPTYAFKASAEDDDNRFKLIFDFNNNYNGVDDNYVNGNFAYQNGDELFVSGDGTLQVFDVMGRFVMSKEIHGNESISVSAFETGVYMLRFVGENIMTQKIVVR